MKHERKDAVENRASLKNTSCFSLRTERFRLLDRNADGYSLVEMLIAIAIMAIVLSALIALLSYTTQTMNRTQARVALQNESKDVVNHISGHVMEGNHATWDKDKKLLCIEKDVVETDMSGENKLKNKQWYYFYLINRKLYFKNVSNGDTTLAEDKKNLLADNVEDFTAEPDKADARVIHLQIKLKDDISEFESKQDIYIRNSCKGGGVHDA